MSKVKLNNKTSKDTVNEERFAGLNSVDFTQ